MKAFEVKPPTVVDRFVTSDRKIHDCLEVARCHEVFLALCPYLPKTTGSDTYIALTKLARDFDFVPRAMSKAT